MAAAARGCVSCVVSSGQNGRSRRLATYLGARRPGTCVRQYSSLAPTPTTAAAAPSPRSQVVTVEGVGTGDPAAPADGGEWFCSNAPWVPLAAACSSIGWPARGSAQYGSVPIYSCWRPNWVYCNRMSALQVLPLNTWTSLRMSRRGNSVSLWVDGVLQFSYQSPTPSYRWSPTTPAPERVPYRLGSVPTSCQPESQGGCTGTYKLFQGQIVNVTLTLWGAEEQDATTPPSPPSPPAPPTPPPPPSPLPGSGYNLTYELIAADWRWTGGSGSSLTMDSVMGSGTFLYDRSSFIPLSRWVGDPSCTCTGPSNCNCNSRGAYVPSTVFEGVGTSCCSWSGNCGPGNPNCNGCAWYIRSSGVYFRAGSYTWRGSVDDWVTVRLIPENGGQYVTIIDESGGGAHDWAASFTVPSSGLYAVGIRVTNGVFCTGFSVSAVQGPAA